MADWPSSLGSFFIMSSDAEVAPSRIAFLGVPYDAGSSFLRGPANAPAVIRRAMASGASNLTAEDGYALNEAGHWIDAGDVACANQPSDFRQITRRVASLLQSGARVLSVGGDHSISLPILRAFAQAYPELCILHLDAHSDIYDEYEGNRLSHACPFARIMEEELATRLVQVGIRTLNAHQRQQIERFNVEVHEMNRWHPGVDLRLAGPLYLSIDIDVLDPAYAPGVSHREPGGLSVRELLGIIQAIDLPVVGADIVEYNPDQDVNGMSAAVCVKLIKEVSALLAAAGHG